MASTDGTLETQTGSSVEEDEGEIAKARAPSDESVLLPADSEIKPAISLVMPTMNEEQGIAECIERAKNGFRELGVKGEIVVSDDSTDRTPEIADEMGAIVVNPDGKGYGYAYRYAFERARADVIAMGDADTTYDFEELPKLYDLVESGKADMAMGSRLGGEIMPGAMPSLHQYVGNPLLTKFLNVFYGAGVSDAHSGMRVFTRDAWERMDCTSDGMEFASEMIMEAGAKDLSIEELPITYHEREGEAKLESFTDGWRHVRFMLVNAPGYLFGIPGAMMTAIGALIMAFSLGNVSLGVASLGPRSMLAGSLLVLVGFQVVNLGAFATVAGNPVRGSTDAFTRWFTEHVSLEKGVTIGLVIFGLGAAYSALVVGRWVGSGFETLPFLMQDMAAMTAIVLGVQMVFGSFFLSALATAET